VGTCTKLGSCATASVPGFASNCSWGMCTLVPPCSQAHSESDVTSSELQKKKSTCDVAPSPTVRQPVSIETTRLWIELRRKRFPPSRREMSTDNIPRGACERRRVHRPLQSRRHRAPLAVLKGCSHSLLSPPGQSSMRPPHSLPHRPHFAGFPDRPTLRWARAASQPARTR
jgi:hypothetical protein